MNRELSNKIIKKLAQFYSDVRPGLEYSNLYELTISVVLSAQTTDKQVNSATPALFRQYPDFESLSKAGLRDVEKKIRSTGFYKNKSKNIIALSKFVNEKYNGILPGTIEDLVKLPGVGRKSANVILSAGFNIPAFAVDTHIIRISNRLGYVNSKNPIIVEKEMTSMIDKSRWSMAHLLLIRHGRETCKARKPLCFQCPISELCFSSEAKNN